MRSFSIKNRLWLTAAGAGALGLLVVLGGLRAQREATSRTARHAASGFKTQVEQSLARWGMETRAFVAGDAVQSGDPARLIPHLNALVASYGKRLGAVVILNRHGKVIAANTVDANGSVLGNDALFTRDLSSASWFSQALADFADCSNDCVSYGEVRDADEVSALFRQTGRFFTVSAPIRHPRTGELLGIWSNRVSWEALTDEWNTALRGWLDEASQVALIDGKGSEGLPIFTSFGAAFSDWQAYDQQAFALSTDSGKFPAWRVVTRAAGGSAALWALGALLLCGFALAFIGWTVRRSLGAFDRIFFAINDQADHLKSAASQLTSCSQDLAQSATEQASSLQQTASSIDEINSMVNQSAENAERSAKIASDSQQTATRGRQVVDDMIRAIGEIQTSNGSILKQVEAGNQQLTEIIKVISEIGSKTKVINDIAFQTKLLSFNASVEAARAGEHGKGFAVVAEEVGSLANMSAHAAKEINDMLAGSIQTVQQIVESSRGRVETLIAEGKQKIESGIDVARQCETVLEEIVKAEAQMNAIINQIAGATREQAQGIGEITKAIGMMDVTTQRNASIAQQTEEFAEAIASLARALKDEVVGFRARLENTAPPAPPPEDLETATSPFAGSAFASTIPHDTDSALASMFGGKTDSVPSSPIFKSETPKATPAVSKAKVIPLRSSKGAGESPIRGASTESLEETPSESDPRFKEV